MVTLPQIVEKLSNQASTMGLSLEHIQSNAEFELIDAIHQTNADFIIINHAAFTHTSVALIDSILSVGIPLIEVH